MVPIDYVAVLVAALVPIVVGFIWHGPLFGREWARLSGVSEDSMKDLPVYTYPIMILGALLMSFVLSHNLIFASAYLNMSGMAAGLQAGFWTWLGFVAPVTVGVVLWEGKPWKLWVINSSYYLVGLCVMGVILALWQ